MKQVAKLIDQKETTHQKIAIQQAANQITACDREQLRRMIEEIHDDSSAVFDDINAASDRNVPNRTTDIVDLYDFHCVDALSIE